jgi:hypothetical protein
MKKLAVCSVLLLVTMYSQSASAGYVIGVTGGNTGVGVAVDQQDVNWSLTGPGGVNTAYRVRPAGVWSAEPGDNSAHWIGPDLVLQNGGATGQNPLDSDPGSNTIPYVYSLAINVDAGTAPYLTISGKWATDNDSEIFLNGVSTGQTRGIQDFGSLLGFTVSGFVAGLNTLEIKVINRVQTSGNPSGLLVTNVMGAVPEPAAVAVWGFLGLVGFTATRRLRRS